MAEFKEGTLYFQKDGQSIPFSGVIENITFASENSPTNEDILIDFSKSKSGSFSAEVDPDDLLDMLAILQTFIVGDPTLFMQLDMNDFREDVWFISQPYGEKDKVYIVKDPEMKKSLYRFVRNNSDRCWRGKKKIGEKA